MGVDAVSAVLRGLSFIALFQAVGGASFLVIFDPRMRRTPIVRLIRWSAVAAIVLLTTQYLMEAARMSGDYLGVLDAQLQSMVAHSSLLLIYLLRVFGLLVLLICVRVSDVPLRSTVIIAALTVVVSFALTGHTAARPYNPLLSLLLILHVAAVAFWFGSLLPLLAINSSSDRETVAIVVEQFSRMAVRIVPWLFAAGALLIAALFYTPRNFLEPYGLVLLGKLFVFTVLMGLAALNRWRLGPQLSISERASRSFSRSVQMEYALISAILMTSATLTTFFSPTKPTVSAAPAAQETTYSHLSSSPPNERTRGAPIHRRSAGAV